MIFFYVKIDRAIFTEVGLASYLCCLLLHLFQTTKRHPSDVEPSYIPIFRFIRESAVYCVGVSKDYTCFTQMINYNSKDLVQILTKMILIIASGRATSVPNFSWIGVRVCELTAIFQVCEKTKKKLKVCSLISRKRFTQFSSNSVWSLPW